MLTAVRSGVGLGWHVQSATCSNLLVIREAQLEPLLMVSAAASASGLS